MADNTLPELPYERAAMAGEQMPKGLKFADQIMFLALRALYDQYYTKKIDRGTAKGEKQKILVEYKNLKFREELGEEWAEIIKQSEEARCNYRKDRTLENADKLLEAVEGVLKK